MIADGRACDICASLNGQRFKIAERVPGVNFPPMHPWCRCTFVPVYEGSSSEKRAYFEKDGLTSGGGSGTIEVQTDWQGNPTKRDVKLSDEAKSYDEQLQEKSDYITGKSGAFREDDVRQLSAKNGVEYACLTIGDESVLIRGDSSSTSISDEFLDSLVKNGGTFDYHTHPYDGDIIPSQSDMSLMGKLSRLTGQETSKIISTDGKTCEFNEAGLLYTSTIESSIDEERKKALLEMFGGGSE